MVSAIENKKLLQHVFSELSHGNSAPFLESLSDEIRWVITGTTKWSRTYEGKQAVLNELLAPLRTQFAGAYKAIAKRFIAEDDYVAVEFLGQVVTKTGKDYNNSYCYIFRMGEGKVREITEYLDTELVTAALADPVQSQEPNDRSSSSYVVDRPAKK